MWLRFGLAPTLAGIAGAMCPFHATSPEEFLRMVGISAALTLALLAWIWGSARSPRPMGPHDRLVSGCFNYPDGSCEPVQVILRRTEDGQTLAYETHRHPATRVRLTLTDHHRVEH